MAKTVFQELSRFMPEKEREDLLQKLKKSLYVPEEFEEKTFHKEIDRNQREEFITRDLNRISWFSKLVLWIRSKIRGKSVRELYVANTIKILKKNIASKYPGITGFETRDLGPKLAEEIFSVYTLTVPVRDIYQQVWMKSVDFENMFMALLEQRIPNVIQGLFDLLPSERLAQLFTEHGAKSVLVEELKTAVDGYIDSIPDNVFSNLEKDMLTVTATKDLVLYQYKAFFQLFHFTPLDEDLGRKTFFKNASAMLCLQHLERLNYALNEASMMRDAEELPGDILKYLTFVKEKIESASTQEFQRTIVDENDEEDDLETAEISFASVVADPSISVVINRLIQKADSVYKALPLEELIRYFTKDPYYELVRGLPELRLKELYVSVLRLKLNAELERIFPEIRNQVIESEIQALFEERNLLHFRNYREYESIDYKSLGLPYFRYTRSVLLLFNYVRHFYKDFIHEGIQVLERGVLAHNRITRDRLLQYAAAVEEIESKIAAFDYSMSPDSEDGKLFQRLRFTLAQDRSHQRMYRTLVLQKDREILSILERGVESISGLRGVFDEIVSSNSDVLRLQLNNHYYIKGKPQPLEQILGERRDHQKRFVDLVGQVLRLEKG